jgi:hypothetical protein
MIEYMSTLRLMSLFPYTQYPEFQHASFELKLVPTYFRYLHLVYVEFLGRCHLGVGNG